MDENNGLICAWILDGQGGGRQVGWDEANTFEAAAGSWLWLHFDYASPAVHRWLFEESGLSALTIEALKQAETRPRVVPADGSLMVFLRAVNLNPGAEPDDMVSARLWLDQRRVISLRHRRLLSVDDLRAALAEGKGPATPGDFLAMFVDGLLDRIDHVVEVINDHIDELEAPQPDVTIPQQRGQLAEMRRQAIALRRFLAPQREALNRLAAENSPLLGEEQRLQLREQFDRLTRIVEDLDAARERAAVAQESLASLMAEQTNQRMFLLSVVAAIFLPLSFATGLLGINVGGIPGTENPLAFAIVVVVLLAAGAGLWLYFRSRDWF
ncbi:MAG: zinc transporter ZntB [Pseudomonadota bacterium]